MDRTTYRRRAVRTVIVAVSGVALFVLAVLSATGRWDNRPSPLRTSPTPAAPWYRAVLKLEGGYLPFLLQVPRADVETDGVLVNGVEEITVRVRPKGEDGVVVDFPHYDSRIEAIRLEEPDRLAGVWLHARPGGELARIDFEAFAIPDPLPERRFPRPPADMTHEELSNPADFSHVWQLDFAESGRAKGVFVQSDTGVVTGTVLTPTGDYRYLAGRVHGSHLRLSTFDGAHAFLFYLRMAPPPDDPLAPEWLSGVFYSGNHYKETFTGQRADRVELPDPLTATRLAPGVAGLGIELLKQAPFAGAPVIVTLMGTWCPNCHDEVPVLKALLEEHAAAGLQILGLAFEYTEEVERSQAQIDAFRARHRIDWTIVPMGTSGKEAAAAAIDGLDEVRSYPTTVFISRTGDVHAIHTGFSGPATGHSHTELIETFERLAAEIVAR